MTSANETEFYPGSGSRLPTMIVLPGGGYGVHADHEGHNIAIWLNSIGLNAVVLRYPIAPARHPAAITAARLLLSQLRAGQTPLSVDPERVGVIGFSAGGHLAALLSAEPSAVEAAAAAEIQDRPALAILAYPLISWLHETHEGSINNFFGQVPARPELELTSAELLVDDGTPPTFLWHTADDGPVSVRHSLRYADALSRRQIPFELHVFERGDHGKGLAVGLGPLEAWIGLARTWLADRGWIAG